MPRFAVIGAGPAGIYAANLILNAIPDSRVDIFEKLPAPYGLVRYGVAPDHPRIKGVINSLAEMLSREGIHLYANLEFGKDFDLDDLKDHYHGVIFATGAIKDAPLNLAGSQLPDCHGAADFVSWYDGHPDFSESWHLGAESVAIIGNGNVALDITRIMLRPADELLKTEIPDHVYATLKHSALKTVHLVGRRGPLQVKFTPLELRELGQTNGISIELSESDFLLNESDPFSLKTARGDRQLRVIERVFADWRKEKNHSGGRRLVFHFYSCPVEILSKNRRIVGLRVEKTQPDKLGAVTGSGNFFTIPCQAVYRAVGYWGRPLPSLPFDKDRGIIPNLDGRILKDNRPLPGLYTTGWIKRGPVGLIGHTKSDAMETVRGLVEDRASWWQPKKDATDLEAELRKRGLKWVSLIGWLALDKREKQLGRAENRERKKLTRREDMLEATGL